MLLALNNNTVFLSLLCSSILHGLLCGYLAERRRCNPWVWFFIGMMCGICGLIALFVTTKKKPRVMPVKETIAATVDPKFYSTAWYYVDNARNQQGPIDFSMLKKLIEENKISKEHFIWCEEWDNWKLLKEVSFIHSEINVESNN